VTRNGVEAFVDSILSDRRPKQFRPERDDTDLLRAAIELRASQSEPTRPDPKFVEDLRLHLAASAHEGARSLPPPAIAWREGERVDRTPASRWHPSRLVSGVGKAAAVVVLVTGTFSATTAINHQSAAPVARRAPGATTVRSGDLLTAAGRTLGYAYAYNGEPSWVFMDVEAGNLAGAYTCELRLADGSIVPMGAVVLHNGRGNWAHVVTAQVSQLRQATLVSSTGITLATATFS
jgi:hypothetical protein